MGVGSQRFANNNLQKIKNIVEKWFDMVYNYGKMGKI